MQFKEDPRNLIVPLELTKIIYSDWDAEQAILDRPDQVYGKALHGDGKVVFKNGNTYNGEFYNGMLHGKGKFVWTNGVIYDGDFTYNKISGIGIYKWPDGSEYFGQVINGLRNGDGKFTASGESAIYEGQWQDGLRHGQGKVIFKSGAIYEGQFQYGNKQGQGKMIYPTQNYYQGQFQNDKKCGYGTMNWLTSNEKYYGNWKENFQNGWGTHIWLEPKGEGSKYLRNRYEGEWVDRERQGVGVFYYANGAKYIGQWQNNMKQGLAMFITDSGGIILGSFKQDRLSQVHITTENEQKSGILPREIAPKSKDEQDQLQEQIQKSNSKQQSITKPIDLTKTKKSEKNQSTDKLVGLNQPNGSTNLSITSNNINSRTLEANPYSYMIDFTDLFRGLNNIDILTIEQNVQTMLLRHNSALRSWYKFFATKYEAYLNENTFALNFEGFWKIIRDAKLLNPNFTLATLNRLFYSGMKNAFPLNYDQRKLNKELNFIKQNMMKINLNDIQDVSYMEYSQLIQQSLKTNPIDYNQLTKDNQLSITFDKQIIDAHDRTTVVLYRHFVELLVRIAYLKYGSFNELHRAVERIILNKLTPLYERKLSKGLNQSEDDQHSMISKQKINFEDYVDDIKPLFDLYAQDRFSQKYGFIDRTVQLYDIFQIFEGTGMISDLDKQYIVAHIEKFFDNDEGSINQLSSFDQSSIQQTNITKDEKGKRRKQQKDGDSHIGGTIEQRDKEFITNKNLNKLDKWIQYQHYELILYEFTDIMITFLVRKQKDLLHQKDEEQHNRFIHIFDKLIAHKTQSKKIQTQQRIFPISLKDQQKEELRIQRIQQESRAKYRQLLEEERKREERERNLMALEDQNIKSDNEDEEYSDDDY